MVRRLRLAFFAARARGFGGVVLATIVMASAIATCGLPAQARRRHAPTPAPTTTPVPVPIATPLSAAARVERMRGELGAIANDAPGRLGIAVLDLTTGQRVSIRGSDPFALANVAKLPIAIAAYRLADQRKLDLDERVTIARGDLRRGSSQIAIDHPTGGASYAYWQLIRAMLVGDDETATDVVSRAVGGPRAVGALLQRLGVRGLELGLSNANGTPDAMATLVAGLATQRYTLLDATNELLLDLDGNTAGASRFRAGFPASFRLAHVSGASATIAGVTAATNDAALVTLPDGERLAVVAFLANSHADAQARDATLARVARAVAAAYLP